MSFLQDTLYPKLPVFAQNIGISAFGYQWYKRRFGGIFQEAYNQFKERENYTSQQWQQYQQAQLQKLLLHAFETVPYYQQVFKKADLNAGKLRQFTLADLHTLPFLEKETLRKLGKSELVSSKRQPGGTFLSSSGSTGTPVSILYSHNMHQQMSALYEARVRNWAGVDRHHPRGMIGGRRVIPGAHARPPFYRYNFIEKQVYFSAYHINANTAPGYVEGLRKYNTQYMVGYAMSNYILANFIKAAGIEAPAMKAVLTSSEKLTFQMRQTLEEVYRCKVFDAWSGVENCGLISENEHRQLLISPDSAIIEILKPDGSPANPGEEGELVCTGFLNYDQPLIRYRIGDVVKLATDQLTKCGRSFAVVEEIAGRTEDVVIGADGRQMVRFHSIFLNLPNVIRGQVVQETLTRFVINIMTNGLTAADKKSIQERMHSQLGDVKIEINEMSDLPVGANGKFRAVISKVKATNQAG